MDQLIHVTTLQSIVICYVSRADDLGLNNLVVLIDPLMNAIWHVERLRLSLTDTFGKKQSNATILYSCRDPPYSLSDFFEIKSVYIARSYRTTLTFLIENNQSNTYLDDISVNSVDGSQMIVNGDFDSGSYGWDGFSSSYGYYHLSYVTTSATVNSTLSQTFSTTPGTVMYIRFKLRWDGEGPGIFTKITID